MNKGKVIVALSGGVDSSVAAALLVRDGWEVEGVFMKNWSPEDSQGLSDCPWRQDQEDAEAVCKTLGIPFRSINFENEYREIVLAYFLKEYEAGRTPNPDVMCNKEIKFKLFLDYALRSGADYMATGHYARRVQTEAGFYVKRGVDPAKDQSYFLWQLSQNQLERSLFPVGELKKTEVRLLAKEFGLPTATKKDSQGICFIGHLDVKEFLKEHITGKTGEVRLLPAYDPTTSWSMRLENSDVVGDHPGVVYYTLGERAGQMVDNGLYRKIRNNINVPPLFIVDKDISANILYITDAVDDPDLYSQIVYLEGIEWTTCNSSFTITTTGEVNLYAQARYQQKAVLVKDILVEDGRASVLLDAPVKSIAPGQSLVLYRDNCVVGGGIVCHLPKLRQ